MSVLVSVESWIGIFHPQTKCATGVRYTCWIPWLYSSHVPWHPSLFANPDEHLAKILNKSGDQNLCQSICLFVSMLLYLLWHRNDLKAVTLHCVYCNIEVSSVVEYSYPDFVHKMLWWCRFLSACGYTLPVCHNKYYENKTVSFPCKLTCLVTKEWAIPSGMIDSMQEFVLSLSPLSLPTDRLEDSNNSSCDNWFYWYFQLLLYNTWSSKWYSDVIGSTLMVSFIWIEQVLFVIVPTVQ